MTEPAHGWSGRRHGHRLAPDPALQPVALGGRWDETEGAAAAAASASISTGAEVGATVPLPACGRMIQTTHLPTSVSRPVTAAGQRRAEAAYVADLAAISAGLCKGGATNTRSGTEAVNAMGIFWARWVPAYGCGCGGWLGGATVRAVVCLVREIYGWCVMQVWEDRGIESVLDCMTVGMWYLSFLTQEVSKFQEKNLNE